MLDVDQTRFDIIRPALQYVGAWSQAAENLVLGTGLVESRLTYVRQIRGPALGLFQMEPATHDDIWKNWLSHPSRDGLRQLLTNHLGSGPRDAERMVWDLRYATLMCRLHYRRVKAALPAADDIQGMARYWKDHYNTSAGKGDPASYVAVWRTYAM